MDSPRLSSQKRTCNRSAASDTLARCFERIAFCRYDLIDNTENQDVVSWSGDGHRLASMIGARCCLQQLPGFVSFLFLLQLRCLEAS